MVKSAGCGRNKILVQSPLCPLVAIQPFLWASVAAQWPHFGCEDSVTSAGTTLGAAGTREPEGRRKPGGQEQAPAQPLPAPGPGTWGCRRICLGAGGIT